MNKFGLILGVTAVTALAGCLDPNYKSKRSQVTRNPSAPAAVEPTTPPPSEPVLEPVEVEQDPFTVEETGPVRPAESELHPITVAPVATPTGPSVTPPPPTPPAEPEATEYIIQPGDTLSKISKRYNIKLDAIRRANPQVRNDVVVLGSRIKLPGRVDVGEQKVPVQAVVKPQVKPYTGATQEYVVKSGDVLGSIARKFKCTTAQLVTLNGLASANKIRVGQKLRVPANGAVAVAAAKSVKAQPKTVAVAATETPAASTPAAVEPAVEAEPAVVEPPVDVEPAPQAEETFDYTVKDGEDMTNVSIMFNVNPSEIRALNNLGDDAELTPGMRLKLPSSALQ